MTTEAQSTARPPVITRKAIPGSGVYQHYDAGGQPLPEFSVRLTINRRRTFRKLDATTRKAAVIEARNLKPTSTPKSFDVLADLWLAAGCPGKSGTPKKLDQPKKSAGMLRKYFGTHRVDEIKLALMDGYADWRRKFIRRGKGGGATVQLDLVTLSNILHFGVKLGTKQGFIDINPVYRGRDRYHKNVRHAREVRPKTADVIHQIAAELLANEQTAVHGWHSLFAMFTGCRTSELLRLRRDAKGDLEQEGAGFIRYLPENEVAERTDGTIGHLYLGRRSKNGMNPWTKIGVEFRAMLTEFFRWHDATYGGEQPYYFPVNHTTLNRDSFGRRLAAAAKSLGLPHVTPHGYRSYYATKRLRDGATPRDIAAEMGDKTVALVDAVYADHPDGAKLHWTPLTAPPVWTQFGHKTRETMKKANE